MKTIYKIGIIGFVVAIQMSAFVNCSKMSTSQSDNSSVDTESNASINFKAGFIAPTSTKGKAIRSLRRSTETQQNQTFVTLKEYRHKLLDRYFLTSRVQDQNLLENDPRVKNDWEQTGQKITVSDVELAGYSPLCRFYNNNTKTHFYTANSVECEQLKGISGFVYEGIEGYAVAKNPNQSCGDLVSVYRVFANSSDVLKKRHRYISDDSFVGSYVNKGWEDEKLSFCAEVVVKPTLTTVYPVDFSTATSSVWNPGSAGPSSAGQFCTPGSTTSQGCPVFSGGTSVRRCNAAGTGYGQCRASCNSSEDLISGMTSQTPSCVKRPTCPAGKKQCAGAGFNLAQNEYSVDCGDDGYDYNRDVVNGSWRHLGYGIIQRKDNPLISGPVCCMNKDGSGLGCSTVKVSIVPGVIIPDETYSQQNPPQTNPPNNPPNNPPISSGSIQCGAQNFSSVSQLVSNICQANSQCVRLNGVLLGSSTGHSSCDDKFGPCMSCISSSNVILNPPNNPVNPGNPTYQSCQFNTQTIAHGQSVVAFASSTSQTSCQSQTRICNNGSLSGSYTFANCQVVAGTPIVHPPGAGCPAGVIRPSDPQFSSKGTDSDPYTVLTPVSGFRFNKVAKNGGLWSAKLVIGSNDTTKNYQYPSSWQFSTNDTGAFCNWVISVSRSCADFSNASINVMSNISAGVFQIITADDSRPMTSGMVRLSPGTWYINMKSVNCSDVEADTNISGTFRTWTHLVK